MRVDLVDLPGFPGKPKTQANGSVHLGRLVLPAVQWTGSGSDVFGTATVTIEQLADAAESRLIWTDQDVQRGILPVALAGTPRELSLADGYPDSRLYAFDAGNADDMVQQLLFNERILFNPLVWNLRPGEFEAYWDGEADSMFLYGGKIFLPDLHRRHQAILEGGSCVSGASRKFPVVRS